MLIVRCSSLDRVLDCSGSLEESDVPYTPNNPEANEGQAAHEALLALSHGLIPDIGRIADEYGVDADELERIVASGHQAFLQVRQWFDGGTFEGEEPAEAELAPGIVLRGSKDLASILYSAANDSEEKPLHLVRPVLERISVLDWKTGWQPSVHPNQLRGYAYLERAKHGMPACGYILGVEVWARAGTYRIYKFDDANLDRLREEILEQVALRGRQFGPSYDACNYCQLQLACAARAEWVRSGVTALVHVGRNQPVTRELAGELYERAKELRKALARYDDVLAAFLQEGPVPLPDGRQLELQVEEQDKIRPSKAMRVLREELRLTPEEADLALSITKAGLDRVVKGRVEKGDGATAMRELMKRLAEVGAVEKTTVRKKKAI